jgi:hypothetical protein
MNRLRRRVADGLLAGVAGGAAMSISTNTEMRLRGRPPSRVPAQTVERLVGIDLDERAEQLLTTAGHVATSAALGVVRGVIDAAGIPRGLGAAAFVSIAYLPDFVVIPALGNAPPPWRWSAIDLATSALHHGVYSAATTVAFARISRRSPPAPRGGSRSRSR